MKETSKFKAGAFDDNNVFVYSTSSHIKYLYISSNTNGVFMSIDDPMYLSYYKNAKVYMITREGDMVVKSVNSAEYDFKIALKNRKINDVIRILKSNTLCGDQIVEYLKEENCADIALQFEKDTRVRFDLCLTSGDINKAFETAMELKEKDVF